MHMSVEHQDAVAGRAAADQPFGRPERIDDGDGERLADGGPGLVQERLTGRGDDQWRDVQAAGLLLGCKLHQHRGVAEQRWWLQCVEPRHDLRQRQGGRHRGEAERHAASRGQGRRNTGGVYCRGGGNENYWQPAGWRAAERLQPGHQRPRQRREESGDRRPIEDEHPALARAASRRHGDVFTADGDWLRSGGGEGIVDQASVEPPVGEDLVELRHHLGLGHHRQARQIGETDAVDVDSGQTSTVEGRVLGGVREQPAEAVPLRGLDAAGTPPEPLDVLWDVGEHVCLDGGPEPLPAAGVRRRSRRSHGLLHPGRLATRRQLVGVLAARAARWTSGSPSARGRITIRSSSARAAGSADLSTVVPTPTARMNSAMDSTGSMGSSDAPPWSRPNTDARRSRVWRCSAA
jgi:hypothetical protein